MPLPDGASSKTGRVVAMKIALWMVAFGLFTAAPLGRAQIAQPPGSSLDQPFRMQVQLVTMDVLVRDEKGRFLPDLARTEFEVYEDGVKQDLASMTLVHGGRVTNLLAPPPPPAPEGIILPLARVQTEVSGRIFLFVVDDLHLSTAKTPIVRDLFRQMSKYLLRDSDMFGIISTGTSAIAVDLTYDHTRFDDAVKQIIGNGLSPTDIIQGQSGSEGPIEVRHRAHTAFSTVKSVFDGLEKVHDRRKMVVYVSEGYDFAPFQKARFGTDPASPFQQNAAQNLQNQTNALGALADTGAMPRPDPNAVLGNVNEEFADAQLARELEDVVQTANRANATIYTFDVRGVVGGGDIAENVAPREWQDYVTKTQDTLRVLSAETGGSAAVNQNYFDDALKRIDAEASDYYVLGYYPKNSTKNVTAARREHHIEIRVTRPGSTVWTRKSYVDR
jgi:VWFA-related protein